MALIEAVYTTDLFLVQFIANGRTDTLTMLFMIITLLGGTALVAVIGTLLGIYFLFQKRDYFLPFFTSLVGTVVSVHLIKLFVARARPLEEFAHYAEYTYSFPSGHAATALVLYGFIAYFLGGVYPTCRTLIYFLASVLIIAIGASRMYLGVHYISDVIGGFILGGLWLVLSVYMHKKYQT